MRLIWKLHHVGGLGGPILDWFVDFLTKREMRTVIRNNKSNWKKVTSAVLQAAVLAPIMFEVLSIYK